MEDLRFPIGPFEFDGQAATSDQRAAWIADIESLPELLRASVSGLTPQQLDTPYREDGWTIRQVVHHLCDSHMNGFIRHKLALTEHRPVIKPYAEAEWAALADTVSWPIESSLTLLTELHARWAFLLKSLTADDFAREYDHPESGIHSLNKSLAQYAWHSRHHLAHIANLIARKQWRQ